MEKSHERGKDDINSQIFSFVPVSEASEKGEVQ